VLARVVTVGQQPGHGREQLASPGEQRAERDQRPVMLVPQVWDRVYFFICGVLRRMVEQHAALTGSGRAKELLADWAKARGRFVKVFPHEYRRALKELAAARLKEVA